MNIQYSALNNGSAPWDTMMIPLGIVAVYQLILFGFLYRILTRGDFDSLNKILWVLVVAFVPLLGFLLYLITAPPVPATARRRVVAGSDVSGTRWADDPNHTKRA